MGWFQGCLAGIWVGGYCWWDFNLRVTLRTGSLRHCSKEYPLSLTPNLALCWCGYVDGWCCFVELELLGTASTRRRFPCRQPAFTPCVSSYLFLFSLHGISRAGSWYESILFGQMVFAAPAANPCLLWDAPGGRARCGLALGTRVQL